jgi:hypothetical protein
MRNDVSHPLCNLLWNGFAACASFTRPCGTLLDPAAGCFRKCKSSILSVLSQGNWRDCGIAAWSRDPFLTINGSLQVCEDKAKRPNRNVRRVQTSAASLRAVFP